MTEQAIVVSNNNIIRSVDDAARVAKAMATSNYFDDAKDAAKAMVKVMAGHELGVGAFASMTGIHIIKGKPTMGGNLIASLIKNDPRYNYRVKKHDVNECEIEFFEDGQSCGVSGFTISDAKTAGVYNSNQNWKKYPRNMLFNRAISNGARWYTPGIFGGAPVYTPEELGADVNEDGEVIEGVVVDSQPEEPPAPSGNGSKPPVSLKQAAQSMGGKVTEVKPLRLTPDKLKEAIEKKAESYKGSNPPQTTKGAVVANLEKCFTGSPADNRHEFLNWLTGHASIKDIDGAMILALKDWLNATQDSGGDWMPCDDAIREARAAVEQYERDNGQKSILGELGVE